MNILAAVLTEFNQPLELREIYWPGPLKHGQVMVQVIASGICGAQLAEIRGEKNPDAPLPRLLGHEAVVRVLDTGPGVTKFKTIGEKAIAHWRVGSGIDCEFPEWMDRNGNDFTSGKITTFSSRSIISENRLTPVPEDTPDDLCALLGCGLSTALGTIEHEAKLLMGESVLIIGCGGLGLNLILAAKLRQAGRIVACDSELTKYRSALSLGADDFMAGMELVHSEFDVVIDTSGNAEAIAEGISKLAPSGRFIMVGQPKPRENVMLTNARHMFDGQGKTIMATQGGRFCPNLDIPRWINAWRAGRLNVDGIVTHRFPLSRINEALDLVRNGQAGRILIDTQDDTR